MSANKPIIVIKKRGGHAGHHGGAWKVAYADFVTAMMSLFIVLWLMNTSEKVRQAVAGYFNDPRGKSTETGTDRSGTSEDLALTKDNIPDLKKKIEEAIHKMNDLKALQNQIQITITPDGLRIELLETKDGTFFDSGSSTPTPNGREMLEMLAEQLGGIPNRISIEGHTDAQQYASSDGYGNWELSTDRANAARRVMEASGLRKDQVSQVRGYADQKLRVPANPMDPSNRRISLIVQYLTVDAPPVPVGKSAPGSEARAGPSAPGADKAQPGRTGADGAGAHGTEEKGAAGAPPKTAPGDTKNDAPPDRSAAGGPENKSAVPAKSGPVQKPSAGKPAVSAAVARLWHRIHPR
jgi:chemotaxis protein MotB